MLKSHINFYHLAYYENVMGIGDEGTSESSPFFDTFTSNHLTLIQFKEEEVMENLIWEGIEGRHPEGVSYNKEGREKGDLWENF